MGGQRDSNPQQPESQSGALPLSYGHRQAEFKFESVDCKGKARFGTPSAWLLMGLPLQLRGTRLFSVSPTHEENRSDLIRRFFAFLAPVRCGPVRRSERGFPEGLHDVAARRETRARQSIPGGARKVPFRRQFARGTAQDSCRLAAGDRRISVRARSAKAFCGCRRKSARRQIWPRPPNRSGKAPLLPQSAGPEKSEHRKQTRSRSSPRPGAHDSSRSRRLQRRASARERCGH